MADGFPSRRPLLFQLPSNPALMTVLDPRGGVNPCERFTPWAPWHFSAAPLEGIR